MARIVIPLAASWYQNPGFAKRWRPPVADRPQITGDIAGGNARYLEDIVFRDDASAFVLNVAQDTSSAFAQSGNLRLSSAFETGGSVSMEVWATSDPSTVYTWSVDMGGRDTSEPYRIDFAAGTDDKTAYDTFYAELLAAAGSMAGRLTLEDGVGDDHAIAPAVGSGTIAGGAVAGAQPDRAAAPRLSGQEIALGTPTTDLAQHGVVEWLGSYGPIGAALLTGDDAENVTFFAFTGDHAINLTIAGSGELLADIETLSAAFVLRAGEEEWVIPGPNAAGVGTRDTSEPYYWLPGAAFDRAAFLTAWQLLSASDKAGATLTIVSPSVDHAITVAPGSGTIAGGAITNAAPAAGRPITVSVTAGTFAAEPVTGVVLRSRATLDHAITVAVGSGTIAGGPVTGLDATRVDTITVAVGSGTIAGGVIAGADPRTAYRLEEALADPAAIPIGIIDFTGLRDAGGNAINRSITDAPRTIRVDGRDYTPNTTIVSATPPPGQAQFAPTDWTLVVADTDLEPGLTWRDAVAEFASVGVLVRAVFQRPETTELTPPEFVFRGFGSRPVRSWSNEGMRLQLEFTSRLSKLSAEASFIATADAQRGRDPSDSSHDLCHVAVNILWGGNR